MRFFTLLLLYLLLNAAWSFAQSNLNIIILPYHKDDVCHAFDDMSPKEREAIDAVSQGFQALGFKSASFVAVMRKLKSQGGCDTHNPVKMLKNVLNSTQCAYYGVLESDFQVTGEGNYVALNLSIYDSQTQDLITYQSTESDKRITDDTRALAQNAFEKMKANLANGLNLINPIAAIDKPVKSGRIRVNLDSEVDTDLPKSRKANPDAIAVVIGNANYEKTKSVDFALNDAFVMKKYLIETFGFKEGNIIHIEDARKSDFDLLFGVKGNHKGKLFNTVKKDKSEVFIFYAGHGATGLNDKTGYFVPTDCDPQYLEIGGYSIETFYQNLALIPAKTFTVLLDACFSGTELVQNVSPIVIKGKGILGLRSGILMASSADDQYATWYTEKRHGLFTYFLLKAIHNQNADSNHDKKLTFQEVYQYAADKTEGIPYFARSLHNIEQNPLIKGAKTDRVWVEF
jgi:hypothetical protein